MSWTKKIQQWRSLTPEQQRQIRLRRLPRKVARSMAFEGEPVDQRMLEAELERLIERTAASREGEPGETKIAQVQVSRQRNHDEE